MGRIGPIAGIRLFAVGPLRRIGDAALANLRLPTQRSSYGLSTSFQSEVNTL